MTLAVLYFVRKYLIFRGIISESSTIPEMIRALIETVSQAAVRVSQTA